MIGKKLEFVYDLYFIAKLWRKLLRNQLNYKPKIFIIKKIGLVVFSPGNYTNGGIFS